MTLQPLDDNKTLGDCGFTSSTARAQDPATIGLSFRQDGVFIIIIYIFCLCLVSYTHLRSLKYTGMSQ